METNNQTQAQLEEYLFPLVKYRETYNEIFDHVLKVLEAENKPFSEGFVGEIIEGEFGGAIGIKQMEKDSVKAVRVRVSKNYSEEFALNFKGKKVVDLILAVPLFLFLNYIPVENPYLSGITIYLLLTTFFVGGLKIYFLKTKKKNSVYARILFNYTLKQLFFIVGTIYLFLFYSEHSALYRVQYSLILTPMVLYFTLSFKIFWGLHKKNLIMQTT